MSTTTDTRTAAETHAGRAVWDQEALQLAPLVVREDDEGNVLLNDQSTRPRSRLSILAQTGDTVTVNGHRHTVHQGLLVGYRNLTEAVSIAQRLRTNPTVEVVIFEDGQLVVVTTGLNALEARTEQAAIDSIDAEDVWRFLRDGADGADFDESDIDADVI